MRGCWFLIVVAALVVTGCNKESKTDKAPQAKAKDEPAPSAKDEPAPSVKAAPALAMVVLIEGHTVWLGNDSYETDEAAKYAGFFGATGKALETLAAAGPDGSKAAVITYGSGTQVRRPFEDARTLSAALMGGQQAHDKVFTRDLRAGLALAATELSHRAEPRKVLVVIGDGLDTTVDADLTAEIDALKATGVEVYTIYGASETLEGSSANMTKLGSAGSFTGDAGDLVTAAKQVLAKINR